MVDDRTEVLATARRLYCMALLVVSLPITLGEYLHPSTGDQYGVTATDKLLLISKMVRNNLVLPTGSSFVEHLVIATKVLSIPADVDGAIVECGCYKGGSTANLSLVAALCDRPLVVFDSFEGMPEPDEDDGEHLLMATGEIHTYDTGSWKATYDEVQRNVGAYGDLEVCKFYPGLFDETMPEYDEPVALAFLDVGLRASAEDAVEHLWPHLGDGCYLFTHEAKHMEIASLFFDVDWWAEQLDERPPHLVGAGSGLGLHPTPNGFSSLLAYTVKNAESMEFREVADDGQENLVGTHLRD